MYFTIRAVAAQPVKRQELQMPAPGRSPLAPLPLLTGRDVFTAGKLLQINLLLNRAKGVTFSLNPAPLQAQNIADEGLEQRASR